MSTMTVNPFRRRKKGPDKAFSHSDTCKIQAARSHRFDPMERGQSRILGGTVRLRRRGLARA
ncbi:MAG TPA: hypothetical protein VGL16_04930 [Actinomycetota bacterium]|jgi:hypothetical protein